MTTATQKRVEKPFSAYIINADNHIFNSSLFFLPKISTTNQSELCYYSNLMLLNNHYYNKLSKFRTNIIGKQKENLCQSHET
jgi:hypothetical protein